MTLALGAGVIIAVAAGWLHFRGGHTASRIQPDRVQLTFTGNASTPGISQDGHRIAYATRQCDDEGRCTEDVVVQDVAGAGKATVVRGALGVWGISWSVDERYLVLMASFGSRNGVFSVPSLGGEPRYLGCCAASVANGDTVLISTPVVAGDSVVWVRWVTFTDGVAHDSLAIRAGNAYAIFAVAFSDGRRLSLIRAERDRTVVAIMSRHGVLTDSLVYPRTQSLYFASPSSDARSLIVGVTRAGTEDADALRYRLDGRGHIAALPDTLIRQLSANAGGDLSRTDIAAYADGPTEFSVWALRRDNPASVRSIQRRLAASTGFITAGLSPAGDQVLLRRPTLTGDGRVQLSVMPFDSGAETPLGPPLLVAAWDWSRDGRSVVVANPRGTDSIAFVRIGVPSGQSQPIETIASSDFVDVETVPGGGLILVMTHGRFRRVRIPGLADSTLRLPEVVGELSQSTIDPSPDGRAFVAVSGNNPHDSLLVVYRVSMVDGGTTRLAGFAAVDVAQPHWLQDGTIIVPVAVTQYTMAWYRLPAGGGPPARLGSPPRYPATYTISADGRRVLATAVDTRPDIYLIPNFGAMLKQR